MHNGQHRCAICDAEFTSSKELVHHEKTRHTQHASAGNAEQAALETDTSGERQNREFTRRNME